MSSELIDLKWYAIHTFSGHENKVKSAIEVEVRRLGIHDKIPEMLVPQETVYEVRNGKRRTKTRNFLSGYVVIRMSLDNYTRDLITNTPSVMGFVGTKAGPTPLRDQEVERILGRVEERKNIETIENSYTSGDPVKVIDGPFSGFSGIVKEVNNEKQKVKVEVGVFGRKTPIELDFGQIEMEIPQ